MKKATPSATALVVALIRAAHTRTAPQPLINDHWGKQLIPESAVAAILAAISPETGLEDGRVDGTGAQPDLDALLRANPAYANVILRSRYTEDALAAAVARGVTQYVLVGAGFDSYALRVPAAAQHLEIFEIDHPATQGLKTTRLAECGLTPGESVHFLPADLSEETLGSVLARSSFSSTEPSFFSLLGVTMYLSAGANRATMREIAKCAAPGSELVFTYVDQAVFSAGADTAPEVFHSMQERVTALGEPFICGFDPLTLGHNLRSVGLRLDEDLDDTQLIERYDRHGVNGLQSAAVSHIARAGVVDAVG